MSIRHQKNLPAAPATDPAPPKQILRLPEVMARTGMRRSWIYREARAGNFPAPAKLNRGGASGWDAAAVNDWIAKQFAPSPELPFAPAPKNTPK
jgi:prophage regulatory protein